MDIANTFSNPETDAELHDALEGFTDEAAQQLVDAWQAIKANPEVGDFSLVHLFALVEDRALEIRDERRGRLEDVATQH